LSPHRFRVGPLVPPDRFRAVDTRWVPVMFGIGAFLLLVGLSGAVAGLVAYYRVEEDSGVEYLRDYNLIPVFFGIVPGLAGLVLFLWGWLRHRAAKHELAMREVPSVIHARWAGRPLP